jgi:hypothetical protein
MNLSLRKNIALLITGVVVLVLIALMLIQVSCSPAIPAPTQPTTPTRTSGPTLTPTPSPTPTGTSTATASTATLAPGNTCQPAPDQVQAVLQSAIPDYFWGVRYNNYGGYSDLLFYGVTTGETKTISVDEPPGDSWILDLARFYYLHQDGTLDSVWATLGFAPNAPASSTPAPYYTLNDMDDVGWFSSQEAIAEFSVPGQVFALTFPEVFIKSDGIHWDQCRVTLHLMPDAACRLGPILDPSGSAQFFASGVPPEGWFAFGWRELPNAKNSYRDPFPNAVTLPKASCP